ncbi:MAG: hypothetical protein HY436_01055 [Candidatus Liptonbacteria bacterium]|nr:hypothetical protein [Candidatus Liptonbacteria bacterium]
MVPGRIARAKAQIGKGEAMRRLFSVMALVLATAILGVLAHGPPNVTMPGELTDYEMATSDTVTAQGICVRKTVHAEIVVNVPDNPWVLQTALINAPGRVDLMKETGAGWSIAQENGAALAACTRRTGLESCLALESFPVWSRGMRNGTVAGTSDFMHPMDDPWEPLLAELAGIAVIKT